TARSPPPPRMHYEPRRGDGGSAHALGAPGREAPPALGELPAVQPREEGLVIGVSPRKSRREPGDELRGKSLPRRALQPFQPLEQLVEQAELFVGQLRRACFERLRL